MIKRFIGRYRWLSNFWPAEVVWWDEHYTIVEHAYQAAKFDGYPNVQDLIRDAESPGEAKYLARIYATAFEKSFWDKRKLKVMNNLLTQKFTRHPELRQLLLDTDQKLLVEGNTWNDKFWGVDIKSGEGKNNLGILLMQIREELRSVKEN